jgi:Crp-like helix-turn-helix domain
MAQDRLETKHLPLTQEFMALMLAVRRAGVAESLGVLERRGLISRVRGEIIVEDRAGLKRIADRMYGVPEAEYLRLTGWNPEAKLAAKES